VSRNPIDKIFRRDHGRRNLSLSICAWESIAHFEHNPGQGGGGRGRGVGGGPLQPTSAEDRLAAEGFPDTSSEVPAHVSHHDPRNKTTHLVEHGPGPATDWRA